MSPVHKYAGSQVPSVLYCEKEYDLLPGECYGPVIRDVYIAECCTEGYGSVVINGQQFPVSPGDCYILLPGDTVVHTADTVNPRKGYWCAVNGLNLGQLFREAGISSENPFAPKELFPQLCSCIQKMVGDWEKDDAGKMLRETAYIYEFLGVLMRNR